jgi:hypothetical protein
MAEADPQAARPWTLARWLMLIVLVFAMHIALLYAFGARKPITPLVIANVPSLRLADASDEWLALNDPTLFALPHPRDFAPVWLQPQAIRQPSFYWTESPRWLPLPADKLGAVFSQFMETNRTPSAEFQNTFASRLKPPVQFAAPAIPVEPALPQNSTLQVAGNLAQRMLNWPALPSLPYNDIIAPSHVQVLVDASGNVASAVLLPSDTGGEATARVDEGYPKADTAALNIARALHFAPAAGLASGELVFLWHTVPVPATNSPAAQP